MRGLVWFRGDLRVDDQPALHAACRGADDGVIGVFLISPRQWRRHDWADIRVGLLRRQLASLAAELERLRVPLLLPVCPWFRDAPRVIEDIAARHGCDRLFFNREYEVNEARRDEAVVDRLEARGIGAARFDDQVVYEPGSIRTGAGRFYTVFTPFRRAWNRRAHREGLPAPLGRPKRQAAMPCAGDAVPETIEGFAPEADRPDLWPAGEKEARRRLRRFLARRAGRYETDRDYPAVSGTSELSPYLTCGAISPRRCIHEALERADAGLDGDDGVAAWIGELVWREFYRHLLVGYPRLSKHRPFRLETGRIEWRDDPEALAAWQRGETGFPLVDAAMRCLADTGWMHNRLRMTVAMFLAKDLLLDWRLGEAHFMRNLVDGDLASNNGGWQWAASTGTDAVPYFRVFNPARQSRRFDPDARFIRRWVPELADLAPASCHEPAALERHAAGYPEPIVDHARARERALAVYGAVLGRKPTS